jgi:hypothetical protein
MKNFYHAKEEIKVKEKDTYVMYIVKVLVKFNMTTGCIRRGFMFKDLMWR